jgi:hypothetical protein
MNRIVLRLKLLKQNIYVLIGIITNLFNQYPSDIGTQTQAADSSAPPLGPLSEPSSVEAALLRKHTRPYSRMEFERAAHSRHAASAALSSAVR